MRIVTSILVSITTTKLLNLTIPQPTRLTASLQMQLLCLTSSSSCAASSSVSAARHHHRHHHHLIAIVLIIISILVILFAAIVKARFLTMGVFLAIRVTWGWGTLATVVLLVTIPGLLSRLPRSFKTLTSRSWLGDGSDRTAVKSVSTSDCRIGSSLN